MFLVNIALDAEGIFRLSGSTNEIEFLANKIDEEGICSLQETLNMQKKWYRFLDIILIPCLVF